MGVIFRNYESGDVYKVKLREGDAMGLPVTDIEGPKWTVEIDGEVAACFGLHNELGKIATLWAYASDAIRGHGVAIIRYGKQIIERAMTLFQRVQAIVRSDREEYIRFVEMFGFEKEGLMRKAAPNGGDFWMYSRVED